MDQLGNKISIALSKDILSVYKNVCKATAENKFFSFCTNDFEIEQESEEDGSAPVYTQTATIVATMTEAERLLFHNQPVIVKLFTLQGKEIVWGTKQYPVRVITVPNISNVSLNFTRKAPEPLTY